MSHEILRINYKFGNFLSNSCQVSHFAGSVGTHSVAKMLWLSAVVTLTAVSLAVGGRDIRGELIIVGVASVKQFYIS